MLIFLSFLACHFSRQVGSRSLGAGVASYTARAMARAEADGGGVAEVHDVEDRVGDGHRAGGDGEDDVAVDQTRGTG